MSVSEIVAIIGVVIALFGLLFSIFKDWSAIAPKIGKIREYFSLSRSFSVSRRNFLLGFMSISSLSLLYATQRVKFRFNDSNSSDGSMILQATPKLVINKSNGSIHHLELCADHLPKNNISNATFFSYNKIHGSKRIKISEVIADSFDDQNKEKLLIETISQSPASTHLYKYLVKLWGKQKKYEKIHSFLKANTDYLEALKQEASDKPRLQKKYEKALKELKVRQVKAKYLASISSLKS